METILDAPGVRRAGYRLSVESYHVLGEIGVLGTNVELLDGFLICKMLKSPLHRLLVRRLFDLLSAFLPAGYVVNKEDPLSTPTSEPEPDIAVVRGRSEDYARCHPATAELVIEVSVTTEEIDFGKAAIYAEAGVSEYWIVEPEKQRITAFRQPKGRVYADRVCYEGAAKATSSALTGFEVKLPALFA